jgi:hypothetical protein
MSGRAGSPGPLEYELRVAGHLDPHWSAWFDSLSLRHEADGSTTLRGPVADQAALHGLLAKVRDVGATLLSVQATDVPDQAGGGPAQPPRAAGRTDG